MRRSFEVNPDDMKRINVIAEREGVTPSTVIRGLIVRGIASYESEVTVHIPPPFKRRRLRGLWAG